MMVLFQTCIIGYLICLSAVFFTGSSANLFSARCRSRCFAKGSNQQNITTSLETCTSTHCLEACLKPCEKEVSWCSWFCRLHFKLKEEDVCRESCKFVKHLHLEDSNSSCSTGVPHSQCVLMRPENVQVSVSERNKKSPNYTIFWNGTWPFATVFVVMGKQQKKGSSSDPDTPQDWTEIKQTTSLFAKIDELQPLVWHQFKVAAVNQYGASPFSVASKFIFANPGCPGPPKDFRVAKMQFKKGHVNLHVSWKKPDSASGLPVHRYRLSWSLRHDKQLEKFESLMVTDKRIPGNIHEYTIKELLPNRTYVLEMQVIARWREQRLRSEWVMLTIRTPASDEDVVQTPKEPVKKVKMKVIGNNVFLKKKTQEDSDVLTKPPVLATKETDRTPDSVTSTQTVRASTPTDRVDPDLGAKSSAGQVHRISRLSVTTWISLAVAIILCL